MRRIRCWLRGHHDQRVRLTRFTASPFGPAVTYAPDENGIWNMCLRCRRVKGAGA